MQDADSLLEVWRAVSRVATIVGLVVLAALVYWALGGVTSAAPEGHPGGEVGESSRGDPEEFRWERPREWIARARDASAVVRVRSEAELPGAGLSEFETVGSLPASTVAYARRMLANKYANRIKALEEFRAESSIGTIEEAQKDASLVRRAEVALAGLSAFENGDYYAIVPSDDPNRTGSDLPPTVEGVERIVFGAIANGANVAIVVLIDHDDYPVLVAAREHEAVYSKLILEDRVVRFNLMPLAERKAVSEVLESIRAGGEVSASEQSTLYRLMPPGVMIDPGTYVMSIR